MPPIAEKCFVMRAEKATLANVFVCSFKMGPMQAKMIVQFSFLFSLKNMSSTFQSKKAEVAAKAKPVKPAPPAESSSEDDSDSEVRLRGPSTSVQFQMLLSEMLMWKTLSDAVKTDLFFFQQETVKKQPVKKSVPKVNGKAKNGTKGMP